MKPFKVAIIGDTHADEHSRFDEHERVMSWAADVFVEEDVDLVAHTGDVFERAVATVTERASVSGWAQRVTDQCPLVVVAGNHDDPREIALLGQLKTRCDLYAMTSAGVLEIGGCTVACLPWPKRASILAAVGEVSRDVANSVAHDALRNVLRGMARERRSLMTQHIFVGHVDLSGAVTDKDQPMVNGDMSLSLSDLALVGADFYGLGHIHAAQAFEIDGAPCVYPGAPRHCNFGEPTPGKGLVIVELDAAGKATVRWRAAPCRPMLLIENAWVAAGAGYGWAKDERPLDLVNAEIRFRFDVDRDRRAAARAAAEAMEREFLGLGAYSVKLEERVREQSRARAPEITKAATTADQFTQWLASTNQVPEPKRLERLLAKLEQIESAS